MIPFSKTFAITFTGATDTVALQDDAAALDVLTLDNDDVFYITGSGTLSGNYVIAASIGGSGTPLANQIVTFIYLGNATLDGNDLTIFGRNLTQEEAASAGIFRFMYVGGSWQSVGITDNDNQPTKYDGFLSTALATGGGTVNIDPAKDKHTQRYTGTGTLSGSWVIQPDAAATPKDGDEIAVVYNATFTASGNNVTILGIALDDTEILGGDTIVVARYDLANTTWRVVYSSTWADIQVESITHSSLTTKIAGGTLVAGKYYLLTDYYCLHNIDDGVGGTILNSDAGIPAAKRAIDAVWGASTGTREPLLLRAISTTQLAPEATSTIYPQDSIIYAVADASVGATRGRITWRRNGTTYEAAPYDLRSVLTIRWETEVGNAVYESAIEVTGAAFTYYLTFGDSRGGTTNGGNTIGTTQKSSSFGLPHCYIDAASVDNKIGQGCFGITIITAKGNDVGDTCTKITLNQSDYNIIGQNSTTWDLQSVDKCLFGPGQTGVRIESETDNSAINGFTDFAFTLPIATTAYNAGTTYSYGDFATSANDTFMYINLLDASGNATTDTDYWVKVYDTATSGLIIPDQLKYVGRFSLTSTNATETISKLTLPSQSHSFIFGADTGTTITWEATARGSAVATDIILDMDMDYTMIGNDDASDAVEFLRAASQFAVEVRKRNYRPHRVHQSKGADVASANDLDLGFDGNYFDITGTTQINGISETGWQAGDIVTLGFDAAPTLKHATAAGVGYASCELASSVDFVASAGDTITLRYDGADWRELSRAVI